MDITTIMRHLAKLKWDAEADCEKGAASLLPILLCANVVCSNRGTCSPNANLDDYVCTCNNTAAGGGGTWGGKDCQLCNGVEPQPSPKPFCSTLNLDMCNGQDTLQRVCPKRCGMCYPDTTTAAAATTTRTTAAAASTSTTIIYNPEKVDCSEQQNNCTTACEQASQRNYTVLVQPGKEGIACTGATDCQPREGGCPPNSRLPLINTTTTVAASTMAPTPVSKGRSMSGGGVAALVIALLLVLGAVGFAGRHQGWVQAPACLSSIKNRHAQYGDGGDSGDGIAFDL